MEFTFENPNIDEIDKIFYGYIIDHNNKYDHFSIKCHFKLFFNDNQNSTCNIFNLIDNKTMIS